MKHKIFLKRFFKSISLLLIIIGLTFLQGDILASRATGESGTAISLSQPTDMQVPAEGKKAKPKSTSKKSKSKKKSTSSSNNKSNTTSAKTSQPKKRPEMKNPPKPEIVLEAEPADYESAIAYAGDNIFLCNNGQWKRFTSSKPKKGTTLTCEIKDNIIVLTEKKGVEYRLEISDLQPFKYKDGVLDKNSGIAKDSFMNPIMYGYRWSPVMTTVEGLYISYSNFILQRKGENWQEFRPETYHGVWAEYKTQREDPDYYYIANSECELKVPKKISKTSYTNIESNNYGVITLNIITDTPKTKLKPVGSISSSLRTGAQTLAAIRYDLATNHCKAYSGMGSKGYISLSLYDYIVCKDKNGVWQQYKQKKPNEAPKEWWLTGETDTHFILRDEEGLEFYKICKLDPSGKLPKGALNIILNRYGQCFATNTDAAFSYFNSDAREVYFPKGDHNTSYFVKDGTQLYEYDNAGKKTHYDILCRESDVTKAENPEGVLLTIMPDRIHIQKPGEKLIRCQSRNFESDTWAPRPSVKNAKMIAYEKAEAEKARKAKIAAAEAEKKRKADLAAAEKKRKAELAAAEKKRKAEQAKAEQKRKEANRQQSNRQQNNTVASNQRSQSSQKTTGVCILCKGSKTNKCTYCNGGGRRTCTQCSGMGQLKRGVATGNGVMWVWDICHVCSGSKVQNCLGCGGRGEIRCLLCDGTGRELSEMEMQIKTQNNLELARLYREIREGNEALRKQEQQQRRKEENEHRNRRALCTYCNGTGASPMPETSQPSATVGIKHYNSVGNKCPYCKSEKWRYTKHWHAQCIHCK